MVDKDAFSSAMRRRLLSMDERIEIIAQSYLYMDHVKYDHSDNDLTTNAVRGIITHIWQCPAEEGGKDAIGPAAVVRARFKCI